MNDNNLAKKKYTISFGKLSNYYNEEYNEIPRDIVKIFEKFYFIDYSLNSNIGYLKEYFLTNFGYQYQYCKCQIAVYQKTNNKYKILSNSDSSKLSDFNYDNLYIIRTTKLCECEYKFWKYSHMKKFEIIEKLIQLEKQQGLKTEELQINPKFEDFYDIIIDINSIKNINKEGWKVEFNKKGEEKYKEFKDKELIVIGVLGNNNKGKSFLLSKLSKIKLPTGTSIQTKGLSIKYPELKGYGGRRIILLDSAGLETPVLKTNKENNLNDEGKDKIEENNINNEQKQNEIQDVKHEEEEKIAEDNAKKEKQNVEQNAEQNEEFIENSRDKLMTEYFLQNFIIRMSDILLLVVGKLTYSEQLLINKIKIECQTQEKQRIFIIHNLQEFKTKGQVEDYIENTLLKCSTFNLKKRTKITTEQDEKGSLKSKKEEPKIAINSVNEIEEKIVITNEKNINLTNISKNNENSLFSEENKENQNDQKKEDIKINQEKEDENINNCSLFENKSNGNLNKEQESENNKIPEKEEKPENKEKRINDVHFTEILYNRNKKVEIFHLILAYEGSEAGNFYNQHAYNFIAYMYNLITEPKKFDIFQKVEENFKKLSNNFLNDKIENLSFTDNNTILTQKIMKLENEQKDLTLKKCYINELGFSLFKTGYFEPKYNYFKPDEKTLEIRIEIPGNVKCDVGYDVIGDETIIKVSGEKKKDSTPKELEDNKFNIREFTKFELDIPLKVQDYQINRIIESEKGKIKFLNGVGIIQFELNQRSEIETVDVSGL